MSYRHSGRSPFLGLIGIVSFSLILNACAGGSSFVQYLLDPDSQWPQDEPEQELTEADIAASEAREAAGLEPESAAPLADLFEQDPIGDRERDWQEPEGIIPNEHFTAVVSGEEGFVAVGTNGIVAHSINGIDWSHRLLDISGHFYDIAYANGVYIAGGGGAGEPVVAVSPDGTVWYKTDLPREVREYDDHNYIESITFTGGRLVATASGGENELPAWPDSAPRSEEGYRLTSLNGVRWNLRDRYDSIMTPIETDGNGFLATPSGYSDDHGQTWNEYSEAPPSNWWGFLHRDVRDGSWVAGLGRDFYVSVDGRNWTSVSPWGLLAGTGNRQAITAHSSADRMFVGTSDPTGSMHPMLYRSSDDELFDFTDIADFTAFGAIRALADNGEVMVGVGDYGILNTYDLATYEQVASRERPLGPHGLAAVAFSEEHGYFGAGSAVLLTRPWVGTSQDGVWWERTELEMGDSEGGFVSEFFFAAWDQDRPVVGGAGVGMEEFSGVLAEASDGLWYSRHFRGGFPFNFHTVESVGGNTVFLSRNFGPDSEAGTWIATYPEGSPYEAGSERTKFDTTAAINAATRFDRWLIGVGDDGAVASTENGTEWTLLASPTDRTLSRVATNDDIIVAIAASGSGDEQTRVYLSEDALSWEAHTFSDPDLGRVARLVYSDGTFIGWRSGSGANPSIIFTSEDGRNWTRDEIDEPIRVVYRGAEGQLLAAGRMGLLLERR